MWAHGWCTHRSPWGCPADEERAGPPQHPGWCPPSASHGRRVGWSLTAAGALDGEIGEACIAWPGLCSSTGWSRAPEPPTSPEHYQTGRCHRGPGHTGERQGASWLYSCQMGSYEPGTLLSTAGQHFQGQAKPQTIQETIHFLPGPHTHPSHGSPASRAHLDRYKETRMAPLEARAQQHSPCRSREGTAPGTGRDRIIQALGNTDRKH